MPEKKKERKCSALLAASLCFPSDCQGYSGSCKITYIQVFHSEWFTTFVKLDVLCLTETWFRPLEQSHLVELCPPDYEFSSSPKATYFDGGLEVVFKNLFDVPSLLVIFLALKC